MKVVLAPDSFKGSLSAIKVAGAMKEGILKADSNADIDVVPMADGGEGTTDNIVQALKGRTEYVSIFGPRGKTVKAKYGIVNNGVCIIEVAEPSGITLLEHDELNPLVTSTYGLGQLIVDALDKGCRKFVIGLGGSATNDCGAGMAAALGYQFLDEAGNAVRGCGGNLDRVHRIVCESVDKRIFESEFIFACDVKNPLCGYNGASYVFGPQKGATEDMVKKLDSNLRYFSEIIARDLGKSIAEIPGAGAAGGLGGGAIAFLNGKLAAGVDIMAELADLDKRIRDSDLVFTGEGTCDSQTLNGKTPFGVTKIAHKHNVPVIIIAGIVKAGAERMYEYGVSEMYEIMTENISLEYAQANAESLISEVTKKAYENYIKCNKNESA